MRCCLHPFGFCLPLSPASVICAPPEIRGFSTPSTLVWSSSRLLSSRFDSFFLLLLFKIFFKKEFLNNPRKKNPPLRQNPRIYPRHQVVILLSLFPIIIGASAPSLNRSLKNGFLSPVSVVLNKTFASNWRCNKIRNLLQKKKYLCFTCAVPGRTVLWSAEEMRSSSGWF